MFNQIWRRLQLIFAQGTSIRTGRDSVQVSILTGETLKNIRRVEPYGFSYWPPEGGQNYLVFPGGDRSYGAALIIGHKTYQVEIVQGEVAIHDDEGNWVHIKRGGVIETKATAMVIADTPLFKTTGDAEIGGNLKVVGQTISAGGYYGEGGGVAKMNGGADITGPLTNNGKNVGSGHQHTSKPPGEPTSEVITNA
ncbi:phage baseplate assembly protein [Herbaspirillum sp.]|uniref:phage baseplate assembly protein domain-containing protein n=1 Tax=Herbaspirillum sp. TaxID=1890675 RepID=UPI001B0ADA9D|nr:phage baseplate assembly protein [Herbaspirillum sp.]MBO9538769.1 phage baseplate assembly protein [Herbaspirillum sp.]